MARHDAGDIFMGGIYGILVWDHDVEFLLAEGISVVVGVGAVELVFADFPARHVLELKTDEARDFRFTEIGFEGTRKVV